MPISYDDYRLDSVAENSADGTRVTRTLRIRADTEANVYAHADVPAYGATLNV